MIAAEQIPGALKSIQSLIVQARHDAHSAGAKDVAGLLDDVESLPALLSDPHDRSKEFEDILKGIAQKHEHCR